MRDWLLGVVAVAIWGGATMAYFIPDIRKAWRRRYDKWFREPF